MSMNKVGANFGFDSTKKPEITKKPDNAEMQKLNEKIKAFFNGSTEHVVAGNVVSATGVKPKKPVDERVAEFACNVGKVDPKKEADVVKALNMMDIDFSSDSEQMVFSEGLKAVFGDAVKGEVAMNREDRSLAIKIGDNSYQKNSSGGVTVIQSNIPEDFDWETDPPEPTYRDYDAKGNLVGEYTINDETGEREYSFQK